MSTNQPGKTRQKPSVRDQHNWQAV